MRKIALPDSNVLGFNKMYLLHRSIYQRRSKYHWHSYIFAQLKHPSITLLWRMAHKRSPSTRKLMTIRWILWFSTWQQTKKNATRMEWKKRSRQSHGHWKLAIHKKTSIIIHHIFAIPIVFHDLIEDGFFAQFKFNLFATKYMLSNYLGLCQMYTCVCAKNDTFHITS